MSDILRMRLKDFCQLGSGTTPSRSKADVYYGGSIPWVKSGELKENDIWDSEEKVTQTALRETSLPLVPSGAVLVAMYGATVGRVGILGIPATTNQAVCHMIPDESVATARFLFHALRNKLSELVAKAAGGAQPNINQQIVGDTIINLLPLDEQRRIAAILDQADVIRARRQAAIEKLNAVSEATFVEMFGEPGANPKRWPVVKMKDLIEAIESGFSPVCLDRRVAENEWGVLKLGAVTSCEYNDDENKALPAHVTPRPDLEVKRGDLLFTRKNTRQLVAASALVRRTRPRLLLPDLIFRFRLRPESRIVPEYLHQLLVHPKKRLSVQRLAGGSAGSMPNISKARLLDVELELPPRDLQEVFARRVEEVETLKASVRRSAVQLGKLFDSLQARAFSGEL